MDFKYLLNEALFWATETYPLPQTLSVPDTDTSLATKATTVAHATSACPLLASYIYLMRPNYISLRNDDVPSLPCC